MFQKRVVGCAPVKKRIKLRTDAEGQAGSFQKGVKSFEKKKVLRVVADGCGWERWRLRTGRDAERGAGTDWEKPAVGCAGAKRAGEHWKGPAVGKKGHAEMAKEPSRDLLKFYSRTWRSFSRQPRRIYAQGRRRGGIGGEKIDANEETRGRKKTGETGARRKVKEVYGQRDEDGAG